MAVAMDFFAPFLGPELVYSDPSWLHATRRSPRRYPLQLRGGRPRRAHGTAQGSALPGDGLSHLSALYDEVLAGWCRR